jgi:membrane fusion protein (multidrug efflux system)
MIAGGVGLLLAAGVWLVWYLVAGQYEVSTDDAYVAADSSLIAAKVGGYVTDVDVLEGQDVRQGQLLAGIDPRDYQAALAAAQASVASTQAQLILQQAKISAASATLQGDEARLVLAAQDQRRYSNLSASGAGPQQDTDQANSGLAVARAAVTADQAALLGAEKQVDVLHAALALAQAQAQQAGLDLGHTQIVSPVDGVVGDKTVAVGDYLQPGAQIMAVVPLAQVYVMANYKETQITNIQPGQKVGLSVDAFPGLNVTGTVAAIEPASGQEFALLPPDNATGNFTKIVQRVPVKIMLNLTPDSLGKLRPGLSVEPTIDTRPGT